ncbi:MAG: ATP-binding protein [Nannocystaceae bacterium]
MHLPFACSSSRMIQDFAKLIELRAAKQKEWVLVGSATTLAGALEAIEDARPDVVLLDLGLPDSQGNATVDAILRRYDPMAVVVLTGSERERAAAEALRAGAQDFLDKSDVSPPVLARAVRYARERAHYSATIAQQKRELAAFVDHAAHDLQAPVRSMSIFADMLAQDMGPRLSGEEATILGHIVTGAGRMRTLISDLVAFIRSGQDEPMGPLDLQAIALELRGEFEAELEETGVTLEIGSLPVAYGQLIPVRLALRCVISNAIKFRAEQAPTVRVTGSTRGDRTVVEVADNGIGIPESAIGSVREAFTRVHGVGGYTGSGLGLTLADRVVRRHAGTLEIESQLREGTTVRFDLPTAAP